MSDQAIQLTIFALVLSAIAVITYIKCAGQGRQSANSNREYFLAGGGLTWVFVAGSITLTNLSTDQLVGMNVAIKCCCWQSRELAGICWLIGIG